MKRILKINILFLMMFLFTFSIVDTFIDRASAASDEVTIAVMTEPDTLDPTISRMTPVSLPIANNIMERLIGITPSGERIPTLASWKVSEDGLQIEFTLRKGIKFHSGDPFTAKDVEFSHQRSMERNPIYKRQMRYIDRVEVVDPYTIIFHFKKPDVTFLPSRSLLIVSKSYYDRVGEEEFLKHPVGTGPYKFVTWKPGQYIDIEANEDYWGEKPPVKRARFRFVPEDTTRVSMLKAGEADIIMETPYALVGEVEAAGFKIAELPAHPSCSVQFHTGNPEVPWYDRKVRLAIAYAIDGDSIVKDLFHGIPGRYARLAPYELGYDPELKPYPYDPEKSKALLAEAGYPDGFEMPLYYFAGRAAGQKETAEAAALFLRAVGIRAKVEGIEAVQMLERVRNWHKDKHSVFAGVTTVPLANYPEPSYALDIGYTSGSPISVNYNPEFDAAVAAARATMDDAQRAELIKKAVRIMHEDVMSIPIWSHNSVYAMKPNIDFTPTVKSTSPLMLIKDVRIND